MNGHLPHRRVMESFRGDRQPRSKQQAKKGSHGICCVGNFYSMSVEQQYKRQLPKPCCAKKVALRITGENKIFFTAKI